MAARRTRLLRVWCTLARDFQSPRIRTAGPAMLDPRKRARRQRAHRLPERPDLVRHRRRDLPHHARTTAASARRSPHARAHTHRRHAARRARHSRTRPTDRGRRGRSPPARPAPTAISSRRIAASSTGRVTPWRGEKSEISVDSSQMRCTSARRSACSSTSRVAMRGASGQATRSARWSAWMRRNIDCAVGPDVQPLQRARHRHQRLAPAWPVGMRRAIQPGAGVERRDHRAQHVDIGMRQAVRRQIHGAVEPSAVRRASRRTSRGAAPPPRRSPAACSRTSRAAGGSRCSGWRAARAGGGCARRPPCRRTAAPTGASRSGRAGPDRTRRAGRHSRHPRPALPCRRARWRRSRRRNPDRRRPGPRSDRPRDGRFARRCG